MPRYNYLIRDREGKILRGQIIADDAKDLRQKLDKQDFFLVEFAETKSLSAGLSFNLFPARVKARDLSVLCWQLYTMLNAGLTLINTLKILIKQMKNEELKNILSDVSRRIEEGKSFSESLREHPKVFSRFFVQMINAGEVGGVLDDMLKKLAVFYENQDQVRSRLTAALLYPLFLVVVSISVVVFMITYIFPKFTQVFEDMGGVMPLPTKLLLMSGTWLQENWVNVVVVGIAAILVVRLYRSTTHGRFKMDELTLNLPVLGDLVKKTIAARFTQTLATLISGGIPILTALEVANETIENTVVIEVIKQVTVRVSEGKSIAAPLAESRIFPDMVVSMIQAGEETGALDKMLDKVAYFYDREVDQGIQTFTKMLEPVLIVMMTSVIGLIGISIFMPLSNLMRSMHGHG